MTQTTDPIEAAVLTVEQRVDELRGRLDPGVRELVVNGDIAAVQSKYTIESIPALDPTFVAKLRAKKEGDYDAESTALDQSIAESLAAIEENIVSEIARRRRLPS